MVTINSFLDSIKLNIKALMRVVARKIDSISNGRVTPNSVTITGLIAHLPLAWLIATGSLVYAGVGLIVFGLFDTLDGELARVQKRESAKGMFLDSVTDRIKETVLYVGLASYLLTSASHWVVLVAVGALGAALITSYINAWGEVAIAQSPKKQSHVTNKALRIGLGGFEIRMFLLVVGLLSNQLPAVLSVLLVLSTLTVIQRIANTLQKL